MSSSLSSMLDIVLTVSSSLCTSCQRCFIVNALFQHPLQQADGLQGLAQIVTGGSEKARLADIGPFRLGFGGLQRLALAPRLGDVNDRHQDLPPR